MRGGRAVRIVVAPHALGRRRTASCLRTAIFLFLVTFVWLQLHMSNLSSSSHQDQVSENDSSQAILSMVPQVLHKFLTSRPRNLSQHLTSNFSEVPHQLTIEEIKRNIMKYNSAQIVHNEDVFGPVQNDTIIIVIQIHTRLVYLRHLIVSLAQARHIESTLIIFSHDFYDEEINELVQSVDFAKVMQIFYPHSIQTHPHEFPGESPGDCPRDITIEQAAIRKCINALTPDLYGHYREAKFTQTKHHWWWKANRVFNQLEVTRNHTGLVLFLEEDHFVAQDFLHILHLMERTARVSCPSCNILSLGTYLKTYNYFGDAKKKEALRAMKRHQTVTAAAIPPSWTFQVLPSLYQHYQKAEVTPWVSSKHNMGFALNRSVWLELWSCAKYFCTYDDLTGTGVFNMFPRPA
ncbi:alpha-1,6-mannosyl-glycoprotein 2-beta-N-acetylglucosaminyltransferase isoform X1 [Macrosteles quadrilineatus]|uniref:alpha-1,6-mannosyl-glycoprotein 2-beta-N-acetylglucosaminyltransferase isoform X1 n=1 Tax=Macrosteles quadrilineatus TaxID=74068 RepID=UPI0023E224B1|nr:alpha-1,6-mannosyl-glycoprotein 2-beta-N-acetylglucosaminyltransferase isoform X1 [Macrosteles quadrilineatus]